MQTQLKIRKNKKRKSFQKVFFSLLILLFLSFFLFQAPSAKAWDAFAAASYKQELETIKFHIDGEILTMLKQAAIISLVDLTNNLMLQNKIVTNWQDYLVDKPANQSRTYMNDYLSRMTTGRGTYAGYVSNGFLGTGNYLATLKQNATKTLDREGPCATAPQVTYEGDPSQMFVSGNFKNMSLYFSGINNPWAFNATANDAYQEKLDHLKSVQQAKAIAYQGFKGTGDDSPTNTITYPGSLTKSNVANVQNIANTMLATATHPEEVGAAIVSKIISQSIQTGFNVVQNKMRCSLSAYSH